MIKRAPDILLTACLICLMASIPSITTPLLKDPTQSGKFFFFSFGIAAVLPLTALRMFFSKTALKLRVVDLLLLILLLLIILNRFWLQFPHGFSMRYNELLGLAAVYFIVRNLQIKPLAIILLSIVAGGMIQAFIGTFQLYGIMPSNSENFTVTGSFFNPGPYSGYLASIIPAALGVIIYREEIFQYIFQRYSKKQSFPQIHLVSIARALILYMPLVSLLVATLAVIIAQSRAAWVGAAAGVLILVSSKWNPVSLLNRWFAGKGYKIAAVVILAGVVSISVTALYKFKEDSANGRILIWKATSKMISDKPLTGVGFDNFKTYYMDYQANYLKDGKHNEYTDLADDVNYAFNEPLQFLAENGIIAGAFAVLLIFFITGKSNNANDPFMVICRASLFAIFIFSCFSYPSQILPIKLNAVFFLAYLARNSKPLIYVSESVRNIAAIAMLIVTPIGSWLAGSYLYRAYDGFKNWEVAYSNYQNESYSNADIFYERAYGILKDDGAFLLQYGKSLELSGKPEKALVILQAAEKYYDTAPTQIALGNCYAATGHYNEAEKAYLTAHNMTPGKLYPQYLLAMMYCKTGQPAKAVKIAGYLVDKKIKIPSAAADDIIIEMKMIVAQKGLNIKLSLNN